ncbi:MAG: serine--tRNA ligase [Candidatus Moranbacteria bacterium]|nr:serine--tRNA ligase [Candidatus Moranbacteria bacterium]
MLDIRFIRENVEAVRKAAADKNIALDLDELLAADAERVKLSRELEELQSVKNDINSLIQNAKDDAERAEVIVRGKDVKARIDTLEPHVREAKKLFETLMAQVPNVVSPDTPIGKSDTDNVEEGRYGDLPVFDFIPKTHIELGKSLDILDLERGTKVGGFRGYYLKNEGALLALGAMMYAFRKLTDKGYVPMIPPTLVKAFPLFGSGYFKGIEYDGSVDEIYQVATSDKESDGSISKEQKFLVGTAEPSLLAYHADEILDGASLPLRYAGFSQCYRSEIGSYGKDTKGMYRVHEFMKVEQVVLVPADVDIANGIQDEMVALSEEMHRELGLPYRKLRISTGDMSAGKYRAFDLEAWMPGLGRYGETGSASNFLDWQSRRLNVRYVDAATGEKSHVYMLNDTALASARTIIAILENHQQADGSVIVPEVLRLYVGKDRIERRMKNAE